MSTNWLGMQCVIWKQTCQVPALQKQKQKQSPLTI